MKNLLCIFLLTLAWVTGVNAQADLQSTYEIRKAFDFYQHNKSLTELLRNSNSTSAVQGSPYLTEEFINGSIYTTSKTQFVDIPLRYNIYNDQVEFKNNDNQILAIAVPEVVEKVEFGEYLMEYIPFREGRKISNGFLLVLEKGEASLYSRQKIVLEPAKSAGAYQSAEPAQFNRKADEFYIRVRNEEAKPVSGKKELLDIFIDKEKDMAEFIKDNKIKTGNAESLRELVVFYNSL